MAQHHALIATDFSSSSAQFLHEVLPLLHQLHAEVSLVHVIHSTFKLWVQSGKLELQAEQRLEHWTELLRQHGITTHTAYIRVGSPAEEIVSLAKQLDVEYIMLGRNERRWLIGSTADAVIRAAHCSVFIQASHTHQLQRILCACDTSELSAKALRYAHTLARETQSVLEVIHCIELPEVNTLGMSPEEVENLHTHCKNTCQQDFENFIAGVGLPTTDYSCKVLWGKPSEVILTYIADSHADMVVMGATGKSKLQMLTIGSTTRNILRDVTCSVAVIR